MVGISKLKIRKKIYKFDVRKRYYSERHYKVKKEEPIDVIRKKLKDMLSPKKEEKKKPARRFVTSKEKKPGFNVAVAGVAILVALIVLLGGFLYLTMESLQETPLEFKPPTAKPEISNMVSGGSVLTAGDVGTGNHIASVLIEYETENIGNYTVSLETFETKLPSEVFVLQSNRVQADDYPSFMNYLRSKLSKKKILVNEITINELETLPQGAVIIVPSGAVPQELLGVGSTLSVNNLADRGMVIIYIGEAFNRMLNGSRVDVTPKAVMDTIPFIFDEGASLSSSGNFSLYQPLYRVTSRLGWVSSLEYGSVSVLKKGDGAFVFLPVTLNGGWRQDPLNPKKDPAEFAADDVSRILLETPWAVSDGEYAVYKFSVEEETSGKRYFYTNPFDGEERSVKILFRGESSADPGLFVEDYKIVRTEKKSNGELYINGGVVVVSTNITNEEVRMLAKLNEPASAQPNMYLTIADITGKDVANIPQGRVNVQATLTIDVPVSLGRGEYTASLIDDESRVYAQSYMRVVTVDIIQRGTYQTASNYKFELEREGVPIQLSSVKVIVDGGKYGTYDFRNVMGVVYVDVGPYTGGDSLPSGDHTFTFQIGKLTENVTISLIRAPPPLFSNPLFWLTIILAVAIAGVGVVFARREQVFYSVDIPDFPPVAKAKIPISPDTVVSIFERVNAGYHWQYTPLNLSEVKNGFKSIFYQGKPVYITDYNTEYVLDSLIGKGRIIKVLNYYGAADWEKKSGRSMTYLAMMRKLRDICVNNAVHFTQMGESKEADSEITVVGQEMFLHFYERSSEMDDKKLAQLISRALSTIEKGITILLFKNDIKKRNFITLLDSPSKAQLLLKLEVENRSVLLLTMTELENMIKELKNV